MVRLVPPFLRNFIGSAEEPEPTITSPTNKNDTSHENADVSDKFNNINYTSDETLDIINNEQLESINITSNIATIASIDWGPPKLNFGFLDEIGQGGKYLFDRIRGNKSAFENPEDLIKNIKNLPKVYESDFSLYLNQINEIYSEYSNLNIFEGSLYENNETGELNIDNNIDNVSREYFEDDYNVHNNIILNNDLNKIPESIEFLESQLMLINNQLRELVGTHLKHVNESFICIEELKNSFTNINNQILNVRDIFDNLKGIYNSPVQYKYFKNYKSNQNIKESNINNIIEEQDKSIKQLKSNEIQYSNEYNNYTLHEVLIFKKKIIDFLGYLKILRGVSCTPEYIQGIVEINNMAIARIFATCSLEYFQTQLSKFVLANSVTLVVKDTIVNLERVAEAKFIDLSFFALTECYSFQNPEEYEKSLKSTLEKIEPVLVVLTISELLDNILTTLESTKITPIDFTLKTKITVDTFQKQLDLLLMGFKHSNIFLIHMFHSIICVYLYHINGEYIPDTSKSNKIVEKMILKIQESFTNGINRDYQKITETTHLLKNELSLPIIYKTKQYLKYYEKDKEQKHYTKDKKKRKNNKKEEKEKKEYIEENKEKEKLEKKLSEHLEREQENNTNISKEDNLKNIINDLSKYYEKFYLVIENAFIKSLEGLFSNLDLDVTGEDIFSNIESSMMNMKTIEVMYKKIVEKCIDYIGITNRLVGDVLLNEIKNKSMENENLEQLLSNVFLYRDDRRYENKDDMDDNNRDDYIDKEEYIEQEGENKEKLEKKLSEQLEREYDSDEMDSDVEEVVSVDKDISKEFESNKIRDKIQSKYISNIMDVLYKYISNEIKKSVEELFEQSLVKIHENLNKEKWELYDKIKLENKIYNLVKSSIKLNEHLNVYFEISEKFFFMANITISKSINLFAYFNTLIENELEKNLCIKKLCLIIQTLDYFSTLIPIKIRNISTLTYNNDIFNLDEENTKNYNLLIVLGSNAENCVLESKLLKKKSSDLLSNFIFSKIKIHLINWIFKYTDLQEGIQVENTIDDVNMICKTISELYLECSELFILDDLKITFGDIFDKLVDLFKKQNVNLTQNNTFSDDCTKIITNLEHLKDIKLEIMSFAYRLSN